MAVTADKYELPICIADTTKQLGKMLGISSNAVSSAIHKERNGKTRGYCIVRVDIDWNEQEDSYEMRCV
jgi:ribosomal protein L7Ae-like RNA K-turn-binding protein